MKRKEKYALYVVTILSGSVVGLVGYIVSAMSTRLGDYIMVIAMITVLFPIATLDYLEFRWRNSIEERMPDILYDIVEGQLSGMSFIRALQSAASKDYGVASRELKRVLAQVKLGKSLEEGLKGFAERTDSNLVKKVSIVISETSRFGGDVSKVIRSLADYIKSIQLINQERRSAMRMYVGVTYIAFGVLVVTIMILLNQFFMPIIGLSGTVIFRAQAGYEDYRRIFFYLTVVQAVSSGLITGKMGEGTLSAGLKHVAIMLFLTLLVFAVLII
ncbi:MAG: type II secretion system F family protein [Candidatus Methanomethylicaceae archaeon]